MIKVLFENSIFLHQKIGGISNYIINLNKNLTYENIKSKVFCPIIINNSVEKKDKNIFFLLKLKDIPRYCRKLFYFINNYSFLIYIKFFKPDLVHFSYYNNFLTKKLKIPYIITVYDLIHENLQLKSKQFSKKYLILNALHIICISHFTKKQLIEKYKISEKKISVIYLGIKKKEIKSFNKKNTILYVGDRGRYKNFKMLPLAYSSSDYLKKNFKIVCIGGNKFNDEEIQLFKNLRIVDNISQKSASDDELNYFYESSNLYVTLSLIEGFGLTPLEAMNSSCPVICSDIPVFKEIFKNACEFVDPNDVESIKIKIEQILKSKEQQKKMINLGHDLARIYTWEKCASETSKLYKKLLNDRE